MPTSRSLVPYDPTEQTPAAPFCASITRWLEANLRPVSSGKLSWGSVLLSFLVLVVVSFLGLALGDVLLPKDNAVTHYLARVYAPWTGHTYPNGQRDNIAVLMYDADFLRANALAWPISYGAHADWLERLVPETGDSDFDIARDRLNWPLAILLDVTFGQARRDDSLPRLARTLCRIHSKVPIFLAGLPSPTDGLLHVQADLERLAKRQGKPCYTLVGVDYNPDHTDRMVWGYPLNTTTPRHQGAIYQPSHRSAAMAMVEDSKTEDVGRVLISQEEKSMALVWGSTVPTVEHPPSLQLGEYDASPTYCRTASGLWTLIASVRDRFGDTPTQALCPYHNTLSMARIGTMNADDVAHIVAGKYVLIGAAVPGYNDLVDSPVHGLIPGIHMHAMALDNLLTYRDDYKREARWEFPPSPLMFLLGLSAMLVVFLVHIAWIVARGRLFAHRWLDFRPRLAYAMGDDTAIDHPGTCVRVARGAVNVFAWFARLGLQAGAAILFIALVQNMGFIRIGMLPVVELVSITILAEGLGYMDKLVAFFGAHKPHASA